MNVLKKSKRTIKSVAVTATTLALVVTPTAALAHGSGGHEDGNRDSGRRTATAQQAQQKQKDKQNNRSNSWSDRNKNRQKLTCDQRQEALNAQAAAAKDKAAKRLNGLNIVFTGVQTYVSSGDVTVENYDAMSATVATDQANAVNAVNAIAPTQLNCADPNAAAANSDDDKTWHNHEKSTNDSINAAKQALSTYKKDLNILFEAVINS